MRFSVEFFLPTSLIMILFLMTIPGFSPPAQATIGSDILIQDLALVGVNLDRQTLSSLEDSEESEMRDTSMEVDEEALDLLIRIIHAEAEGEPYMGLVAVGAVVLNRVKSPIFPDTIHGVVFDGNQFEPVRDGRLHLETDSPARRAALAALRGDDPTGGALYFYNRDTVKRRGSYDLIEWFDTNTTFLTRIGGHTFSK